MHAFSDTHGRQNGMTSCLFGAADVSKNLRCGEYDLEVFKDAEEFARVRGEEACRRGRWSSDRSDISRGIGNWNYDIR